MDVWINRLFAWLWSRDQLSVNTKAKASDFNGLELKNTPRSQYLDVKYTQVIKRSHAFIFLSNLYNAFMIHKLSNVRQQF